MAKKFLNGIDLNNQRLINLADPTASSDAATKQYVDLYINGISLKAPVRAATTANISLSGLQTIDGVSIIAGDRVLVKNQTAGSENGIYVAAVGAWARATDADNANEVVAGMTVFVTEGAVSGDKQYSVITDGVITLGTTPISFGQSAATPTSYTSGNGISLAGSAISVVAKPGGSLGVDAGGVFIDPTGPLAARRYATNVPTATPATITHSLGTLDVIVAVYEVATGALVEPDISLVSPNAISLGFASAPSAGQYRCVVLA